MEEWYLHLKNDLRSLKTLVRKELSRLEKACASTSFSDDSTRNALWMKQIADSLDALKNPEPEKGASSLSLRNIHTGNSENIQLNPKLDISGNAALFRKKAEKLLKKNEIEKDSGNILANKVKKLSKIQDDLEKLSSETNFTTELKDALAVIRSVLTELVDDGKNNVPSASPTTPYRQFTFQGWNIFAGKSDEQNDQLSIHFTSQRDLWFHAAHCPGSHVVLKYPPDSPKPEQEIIEKAAAVAAWFSKSRNAPFVEVHFTEGRFVHKRKNAPKGEVVLEKFKTLKVIPKDPALLFT